MQDFILNHIKTIGIVGLAFLIVGGGFAGYQSWQEKKDTDLQAQFFQLETEYKNLKWPAEAAVVDPVKEKLELFAKQNKTQLAGVMAGLLGAEIHIKQEQWESAVQLLENLSGNNKMGQMAQYKLISIYMDLQKWDLALSQADKLLADKKAQFLASEVQLQKALILNQKGNKEQAEQLLLALKDQKENISSSLKERAQKYLRALRVE